MAELRVKDIPESLHTKIRMIAAGRDAAIRTLVITVLEDHIMEYFPKMDDIPKPRIRKKIE